MLHNSPDFVTGQDKAGLVSTSTSGIAKLMKIKGNLASRVLGTTTPYYVLLPIDYEVSGLRYPVLFLLHGLFGAYGNWTELTDIASRAAAHQLIIVMPEGADGWYTDSATVASEKYETHFLEELLPHVDETYRTLADRNARAIAGLSMGGYGAFKFALKRPDLFCFAASFSGAFDPTQRSDDSPGLDWLSLRPSVMKAFGPVGNPARILNDLGSIVAVMPSESKSNLPFFYFDCGLQDGFLDANRRLSTTFSVQGIAHEFNEVPGGHDWDYWNGRVPTLLQMVSSKISNAR
jgi:S-formylglutathione hydrolase FrmB